MKIIEIDQAKFNKITSDYREFFTLNDKYAEDTMKEWFRYMNYPRETKVYKFVRPNGIKWMVME